MRWGLRRGRWSGFSFIKKCSTRLSASWPNSAPTKPTRPSPNPDFRKNQAKMVEANEALIASNTVNCLLGVTLYLVEGGP